MDDLLFYLALGGAILILLISGLLLKRKYPRIQQGDPRDDDPHLYAVAMRAWETGKPVIGAVDEHGNLKMNVIEPSNDLKE